METINIIITIIQSVGWAIDHFMPIFLIAAFLLFLEGGIKRNQIPFGICISTCTQRIKTPLIGVFDKWLSGRRTLKYIRAYNRSCGIKLTRKQAKAEEEAFIKEHLDRIKDRCPEARRYMEMLPSAYIKGVGLTKKAAARVYNASSYDNGETSLNYAYYEMLKKNADDKMSQDIFDEVYLHELSHHILRLYSGLRPFKKPSLQMFMNHVNECFADLNSFRIMGCNTEDAAKIYKEKVINLQKTKNMYEMTETHPSFAFRLKMIEKGVFNEETIREIAKQINFVKKKETIKEADVVYVLNEIEKFRKLHPDTCVYF